VCLNFYWKLFEWITARYEKNHRVLARMRSCGLKTQTIFRSQNQFFHYEPLSTSSFRKNLSILGAIHFQKANLSHLDKFRMLQLMDGKNSTWNGWSCLGLNQMKWKA